MGQFATGIIIAVLMAGGAGGAAVADEAPLLVLTGARVLDPACREFLEGQDVLIVGDRIRQVGPSGEIKAPDDVQRLDLTGLSLIPGLIDAHSHLLLHPYDEASWNDQVLKESLELRTVRAVAAMQATLEAGFTTLRDLGTEGAGYADVALRDAVTEGIVPGPRVFASTRALVATGCYGPMGFDPRWDVPKGAQVADGVDGLRRAVREQIAAGVDWIKVYADYRRQPGGPTTPTYSQEELNAIVDEARSAGLPVAAHATIDEAIRRCVEAGVSSIEHGSYASEEVLRLMRDKGVVLCPTLAAAEAIARYQGRTPEGPEHPRITAAKAMFQRALDSGVTIACGSDVGVFAHGDNAREIELMVAYGMTPADALKAATVTAAHLLGRANDLGRIADGCLADVVAVRGNPLEDISVLRSPVLVVKNGALIVDRR
ncbi:MAG: amidohydrolase family protein [Phycisphaerales bacterium]|nr:MAG: amidohydrolase family protein [Phycisphaerales bacterium]